MPSTTRPLQSPHAPSSPVTTQPADKAETLDYAGPEVAGPEPEQTKSLSQRTVRGGAWQMAAFAVQNGLRFGSNIVLSRFLSPEIFGLSAITNTVLVGLEQFSDVGVGPSIVQNKKGETEPFLRTAFTIQAIRGVVLLLAGLAVAYPVALYTGKPIVAGLVAVASLSALVAGVRSTAWFRLQRRLRMAELSIVQTGASVLGTAAMIAWAWASPSAWALVVPSVIYAGLLTAASHLMLRDRPDRFGYDREAAGELFGFGGWVFVSTALTFLANSADRFLFAGTVSMAELGIYNIALSLATMPTAVLLRLGMSVVFPALAEVKEQPERFARAFAKVRLPMVLFAGYAAAGLAASGRFFMDAVYPPEYHAAGWMVQILAIMGLLQVLQAPNDAALLAQGKSKLVALAHGCKFAALIIGIYLGLHYGGLAGAVWGVAAAEAVRYVVDTAMVARLGLRNYGRDALLAVWVAASAAGGYFVGASFASPWAGLFVSAGLVTLLWLPALYPAVQFMRNRRG